MSAISRDHLGGRYISVATSRQIVAARVLCIFFMMSVHVSPGFDNLSLTPAAPMYWIGGLWVEVIGRSSVPALSIISGFLMAAHSGRGDFRTFAAGRFRTLYVPMVFWTLVLAALALSVHALLGTETLAYRRFFHAPARDLVLENLLFLYGHPANVPLAFLRDLFLCSLFAYGALRWLGRGLVVLVPVSALIWQTVGYGPLILRPAIPTFLLAGIALQQHVGHLRPAPLLRAGAWLLMGVVVLHQWFGILAPLQRSLPSELWQMIFRIIVSTWALDMAFRLSQSRFFGLCQTCEPVIYLTYLSHGVVISLLWAVLSPVIGGAASPAYPLFFLLAPAAALQLAWLGGRALDLAPGWSRLILSGKAPAARA